MSNWRDVEEATPELAADVRSRLEAHGLAMLATLRPDGSPRISGIEAFFARDDLWLGMMWESLKALDLRRDPRLELHNATVDTKVTEGDARVHGRAVEIEDPGVKTDAMSAFEQISGYPPPPGPFHLFRVEVDELVHIRPDGDHLLIRSWSRDRGTRAIERR